LCSFNFSSAIGRLADLSRDEIGVLCLRKLIEFTAELIAFRTLFAGLLMMRIPCSAVIRISNKIDVALITKIHTLHRISADEVAFYARQTHTSSPPQECRKVPRDSISHGSQFSWKNARQERIMCGHDILLEAFFFLHVIGSSWLFSSLQLT
jgi:hypothetical protein